MRQCWSSWWEAPAWLPPFSARSCSPESPSVPGDHDDHEDNDDLGVDDEDGDDDLGDDDDNGDDDDLGVGGESSPPDLNSGRLSSPEHSQGERLVRLRDHFRPNFKEQVVISNADLVNGDVLLPGFWGLHSTRSSDR